MTPDSPDKQAKDEVLDLNDIAEEIVEDDASGGHDVDASFEQELEDLFSEDLELEEPAVVNKEDDSEDEDLLVLDDVIEEVSDEDLMILDDVVEEGEEDILELDDIIEEADDETLLELDDVVEEVDELESSDSDTDELLENFDLGEESLMADADDSVEGEIDPEGLDNVIDELGGEITAAADDEEDIDNLFDSDTDVADLDQLLEESGDNGEIGELDDLLGEVSDGVDLSGLGEDVLADEDIEGLLSDEEDLIELSEEGLEPLDDVLEADFDVVDEPVETAEVEIAEVTEVVEPVEVETAEVTDVVEPVEIIETVEVAETALDAEEDFEGVDLDADLDSILESTTDLDLSLTTEDEELDTSFDDAEILDSDSGDDIMLDDDDIDLGELLEDVDIDFSDLDEEESMQIDEPVSAVVSSEAVDDLTDKVEFLDSELAKMKGLLEATAVGCRGANLEEKVGLAEKRAEDLENSLSEASERIIDLEEKVAQIDALESIVSSLLATVQGLEERLSGGEIESVVGQKLSEELKADSPAVIAIAATAADEIQARVEEQIQIGLREIQVEIGERIAAVEVKLETAPDVEELVRKELEKELDPDSTSFYRIKSRLTEDIEDYLAPRLVEKIEDIKGEIEETFKSSIDDILAEKLEKSVPAEAARIIREEIAALARDFEE